MLPKQLKENLFVFFPAESVFGVANLESFKVQFAEQALVVDVADGEVDCRPRRPRLSPFCLCP